MCCILIRVFLKISSVNVNYKLFASFLLIVFGILWYLRVILGTAVVLLDESWVAGSKVILVLKLSLFTKTTGADKFKLRFETLFPCLNVPSEISSLLIHYRIYISNTLLPSNCFHSVVKIANEGDPSCLDQLSRLLWTTSEPHKHF